MNWLTARILARLLLAVVFLLNGFNIIDQSIPTRELASIGLPPALVPLLMWSGRVVETVAGLALVFSIYTHFAALALLAFLARATFVSHSFWLAIGTPTFQVQQINCFENAAICGGLLHVASQRRKATEVPEK